jgi:hypothetical protein
MINIFKNIDIWYILIFIICVISILLYGRYSCINNNFKDPLQKSLIPFIKNHDLDGWSGIHLIFYIIIGLLYPKTLILTMILSIIWEIFETWVKFIKPDFLKGYGFCKLSKNNIKNNNIWWYGKWTDIIINLLGFMIGKYIRYYITKLK